MGHVLNELYYKKKVFDEVYLIISVTFRRNIQIVKFESQNLNLSAFVNFM